jgi:hypothetical protein
VAARSQRKKNGLVHVRCGPRRWLEPENGLIARARADDLHSMMSKHAAEKWASAAKEEL